MKTAIRRGSWIVTVSLAAAAVAYVALSFLPNKRAIGEARNQLKQKQDYVVQSGSLTTALRMAEEELRKARAYNTAWEQNAPVAAELSPLYGRIHELAKAAGTTVTRFDPEPAIRYEKIPQVPLAMACVGSFTEVCRFLEGLERIPSAIWIRETNMTRSGEDGQPVSCELSLAVFACYSENSDYVEHSE